MNLLLPDGFRQEKTTSSPVAGQRQPHITRSLEELRQAVVGSLLALRQFAHFVEFSDAPLFEDVHDIQLHGQALRRPLPNFRISQSALATSPRERSLQQTDVFR